MNRGDPDPAYRTGMQAPPLHVDVMGDDHEAYQSEHTNSDIAPCEQAFVRGPGLAQPKSELQGALSVRVRPEGARESAGVLGFGGADGAWVEVRGCDLEHRM